MTAAYCAITSYESSALPLSYPGEPLSLPNEAPITLSAKCRDKQFRRSLRTKDRKLADRRLAEFRSQIGQLTISDYSRLSLDEIAKRWVELAKHALKQSTVIRRETCIKNLSPFFHGVTIRNIQPHHCERCLTERGSKVLVLLYPCWPLPMDKGR